MTLTVITLTLYAPWVHSLKEKRSIAKGLLAKLRNRFNVSALETMEQDVHQTLVITVAAVTLNHSAASSLKERIITFVEENIDAEIVNIEQESW